MQIIHKQQPSYIIKKRADIHFSLGLTKSQYRNELYQSIIQILPSSFSFIDPIQNELYFQAESVYNLLDFFKSKKLNIENVENNKNNKMSYEQTIFLIGFLSKQIQYLENINLSFIGFDLQDVIIINHRYFFIVNNTNLFSFQEHHISLFIPFTKPYFSNPEIIELTKLPAFISYKSCYYSLAVLVIYCFLNEYLLKGNDILSEAEIEMILRPIFSTKMYWFLKRCLSNSAENRQMLFI